MAKLRIKNCGPVTRGLDSTDGFLNFGKYTLLIGDQGTGKSTVAKLFSICSWLEKSFFRGDYDISFFDAQDFQELYHNQLMDDSFNENTEFEYVGDSYHFLFKNLIFYAEINNNSINKYIRPKIMYIPSERNILSIVKNVEDLENLPPMLRLLRIRYLQASSNLNNDGIFSLPLLGYKTILNTTNGETLVIEERSGKSVPLMCASSGLQSIVPSSIVTEYLSCQSQNNVLEKIRLLNGKNLSNLKMSISDVVVRSELEQYITSGIAKSVSESSLKVLEKIAQKYTDGFFMNIVEEPEQNLFPESQVKNIDFLINATNRNEKNQLIMTTHSPYVLSYITLGAKAYELSKKNISSNEIEKVIPLSSWIDGKECFVYQFNDGCIKSLPSYGRGLPSDNNMLNKSLGKVNDKFDLLLDLEEKFDN